MAFASVDLLGPVKAMFTAYFCRFHALAVDNRQTGLRLPARFEPNALPQDGIDRFPGPIPTPFMVMVVHAVVVRILPRQIAPLAARAQHIQDSIDDGSQLQAHRAAWSPVLVDVQRLDDDPLCICHIAWITHNFVTHLFVLLFGTLGWRLPPILPARSHFLNFQTPSTPLIYASELSAVCSKVSRKVPF